MVCRVPGVPRWVWQHRVSALLAVSLRLGPEWSGKPLKNPEKQNDGS